MRENITNREYFYSTLNDMFKFLNSDNVDDFLIDFGGMLKEAVLMREEVAKNLQSVGVEATPEMLEAALQITEFSWIDDGLHDDSKGSIEITF